jgi:hypothetical protein
MNHKRDRWDKCKIRKVGGSSLMGCATDAEIKADLEIKL